MNRILIATHDPGGALAIAPVLDSLKELRQKMNLELYVYSSPIARARLPLQDMETHQTLQTNLSNAEAIDIIERFNPTILLSGTSWNSNAEQKLRNAATVKGKCSIVVHDYWRNFSPRWTGSAYELAEMPDIVCVADEEIRKEMIGEGFPAAQIIVTGHPHLERLSISAAAEPAPKKFMKNFQEFIFLSEPLCAGISSGEWKHPIQVVAQALQSWSSFSEHPCNLYFKAHPKEQIPQGINELLSELSAQDPKKLRVNEFPRDMVLPESLARFDLVIGYQTMGLFESAALGKRVLAIPNPPPNPALSTAFEKFHIPVTSLDSEKIFHCIKEISQSNKFLRQRFYDGACKKIVNLILKEL